MVVFDGSTGYLAFKAERLLEAKREDHPSIRLSCASLRAAMAQMPASSVSGAMRASAATAGLYFAIFPYAASAIAAIPIDKPTRGQNKEEGTKCSKSGSAGSIAMKNHASAAMTIRHSGRNINHSPRSTTAARKNFKNEI